MIVNNAYVWRAAQERLRQKTTGAQFETWLRGTQLVTVGNGVAVLGAPTTSAKEQLETRFRSLIETAIGEVMGARCLLTIEVLATIGLVADEPTPGPSVPTRPATTNVNHGSRSVGQSSPATPYERPTLFDLDDNAPDDQPAPQGQAASQPRWSGDDAGEPEGAVSAGRQRPPDAAPTPSIPLGRGMRAAATTPLGRRRQTSRTLGAAAATAAPAPMRWSPERSNARQPAPTEATTSAPYPNDIIYPDDIAYLADEDERTIPPPSGYYADVGDDRAGEEYGGDHSEEDGDSAPASEPETMEARTPMGGQRGALAGQNGYVPPRQPVSAPAVNPTPYIPPGGPASASPATSGAYGAYGLVAPRLNARYTFSTFIVGSGNRLAHAASQAVAEAPGYAYNPLFLYGGVGLGKTHLLHAIGHTAIESNLTVLYVSSETFTNEIINAIRYRTTEEFRAKYRSVDVLLVDDIQFIAGKDSTEEEFFHTFNSLHETNKQIVMCSDRPPKAIVSLEDRLRSRFEWGLIADIQPPDLETRIAILQAKAEMMRRQVPDDVILFLAGRVQSNIRELEGSLNRLLAFAQLQGAPLIVETAKAAMASLASDGRQRRVSIADILAAVADHYHVPADDLQGKQRDKHIVTPRQVAMYLMRQETDASLLEIGQALGNRDHSTVLHGCEKISREINENTALRKEVLAIRQRLLD